MGLDLALDLALGRAFVRRGGLPTQYPGLLAWYEAPPKSLIATPDAYMTRTLPSISSPNDISAAAWTKLNATTPDANTLLDTSDGGVAKTHQCYQAPTNASSPSRRINVDATVAVGTKTWCMVQTGANQVCYFDIQNVVVGSKTAGVVATITDIGGGQRQLHAEFTYPATANTNIQLYTANGNNSVSYIGDGTGSIHIYNVAVTQDGVVNTWIDLSPNAYHATQATFANMPWYKGALDAAWSTGAPTIYNPGNATGIALSLPAGLVAALAGSGKPWEVIALIKLFAASAASDSSLVRLTGATAKARMISQKAAAGTWGRYRVDDGTAHTDDTAFTDSVAVEEVVVRHVFSGTADSLYKGSAVPLTADASNPLAATAINCSFTAGQLFYNAGATSLAMGVRGIVIRRPDNDGAANNIAAGLLARSAATA